MSDTNFSGPHVSTAFLCEKILIERDGVPSFIRVANRFTVPVFSGQAPPGVQIPQQIIQTTLVISLISGDLGGGKQNIKVRMQKPDHSYMSEQSLPVFFNGGDDQGALVALPIVLASPEEGLYWFDVSLEGVPLTRIPMRVLHQPAVLQFQQPPGEQ